MLLLWRESISPLICCSAKAAQYIERHFLTVWFVALFDSLICSKPVLKEPVGQSEWSPTVNQVSHHIKCQSKKNPLQRSCWRHCWSVLSSLTCFFKLWKLRQGGPGEESRWRAPWPRRGRQTRRSWDSCNSKHVNQLRYALLLFLLLLCIWPVADIADSVHDEGGDKAKPDAALEARKAKLNMQGSKVTK